MKQLWQTLLCYLVIYRQRRLQKAPPTEEELPTEAAEIAKEVEPMEAPLTEEEEYIPPTELEEEEPFPPAEIPRRSLLDGFLVWMARHTGGRRPRPVEYPATPEVQPVEYPVTPEVEPIEYPQIEERTEFWEVPMALLLWWIPALIFYGFGDTLTSALCFGVGATEANPLMATLMGPFGGGMASFVVVKSIILIALVLLSWYYLKKHSRVIPAVLSVLGGYLVGHNLLSLSGLM